MTKPSKVKRSLLLLLDVSFSLSLSVCHLMAQGMTRTVTLKEKVANKEHSELGKSPRRHLNEYANLANTMRSAQPGIHWLFVVNGRPRRVKVCIIALEHHWQGGVLIKRSITSQLVNSTAEPGTTPLSPLSSKLTNSAAINFGFNCRLT